MRPSSPRDRHRTPGVPSDRALKILTSLVREYIEGGEPVSSLWLARHGRFDVSSATLRGTLSELETLGFVRQPHTSAGRVPTDLGYRCYVDSLLRDRRPARPAPRVEARLRQAGTVNDLLSNASEELSRASQHMGFALACTGETAAFRHIDFVPLSGKRVLVVLITATGQLVQKAVDAGERISATALTQSASYLNAQFAGVPLEQVRSEIMTRLREERTLYDALQARSLRLVETTLDDLPSQPAIHVQGVAHLIEQASEGPDHVPLATLRALFAVIEQKDRLMRLLNEYIDGPGLTVVIGAEHPARDLRNFSLVASAYRDEDGLGAVGVIGPRRMRYSRTICAVDTVSSAVSHLLASEHMPS